MATADGYSPYPSNLTAVQFVSALKKAYALDNTLADYAFIAKSSSAPNYGNVHSTGELWYNTSTNKIYRAVLNTDLKIVMWFEV